MPTSGKPVHILDALCLALRPCGGRARLEILLSILRSDADVTTMADRLGLYPSQVSRSLHTLLRDGLATRIRQGRRHVYGAGPRIERCGLGGGGVRIACRITDGSVVAFELGAADLDALDERLGIPRGPSGFGIAGVWEPKDGVDHAPPAGAPALPRPTIGPG